MRGRKKATTCGRISTALFLLFSGYSLSGVPQEGDGAPALTLENIFTKKLFKAKSFGPAVWLRERDGYLTWEDSQSLQKGKDIVLYTLPSGDRRVLVSAEDLVPKGAKEPLTIKGVSVSRDLRWVLIYTNTRKVWRRETRGDYWVFDCTGEVLKKLGGTAPPARLMFAEFSPQGTKVAYVRDRNLYVEDLLTGSIRRLTETPTEDIVNGTSDWVYEEEFGLRKGFSWSPDGKVLAFFRFDTSKVGKFTLVNYTESRYPKLKTFAYPKVGTTNSACRIALVPAEGGQVRFIPVKGDLRNNYIPRMWWVRETGDLVFVRLNRLQNHLRLFRTRYTRKKKTISVKKPHLIFEDKDQAWVDVPSRLYFVNKGKRFLYLSERDGWRHLYLVEPGRRVRCLTPGPFDVISLGGVNEKKGLAYFTASPESPTQRYLFQVRLTGGGMRRLTPEGKPGCHSYRISPNGTWAFHTSSTFRTPPVTDLVRLPEHRRLKVLQDNAELRKRLACLKPLLSEFLRIDIGNGVLLDAWWIRRRDLDPTKRHPLFFYVYGEPAGQTVLDRWGGDKYLWHFMLAEKGYVVVSVDNRGTPAPRGRAWRKCIYRQIGVLASQDQAAAARTLLAQWPFLDPKRLGIWGWSGGGSMSLNAIFRFNDLYRLAMAIAFISDERLYDTIYQERYMGLPEDNEEGYRLGSPITFAKNLKGHLLLIHGTGDDNCHYQSCEWLVNELVAHNKIFSLMVYPSRTHSLKEGNNTRRHLFELMTRYLTAHMPPGGQPIP